MKISKTLAVDLFVTDLIINIVKYRETQCTKYRAESGNEYGSSYEKLEKYKNRTRIIDIFLSPLIALSNDILGSNIKSPKITIIE